MNPDLYYKCRKCQAVVTCPPDLLGDPDCPNDCEGHTMEELKNFVPKAEFIIHCKGRSITKGHEPLEKSVRVVLSIHQYNTGSHGHRCKASYPPGVEKQGDGIICPYSLDLPYAMDNRLESPVTKK